MRVREEPEVGALIEVTQQVPPSLVHRRGSRLPCWLGNCSAPTVSLTLNPHLSIVEHRCEISVLRARTHVPENGRQLSSSENEH